MTITNRLAGLLLGSSVALAAGCAAQSETVPPTVVAPTVQDQVVVHQSVVAAQRDAHPMVSHRWLEYRDARDAYLQTLAAPLLECGQTKVRDRTPECVRRSATFEVAYALTALYGVTHDGRYAEAADRAYDREVLTDIDGMEPYAAAWFLTFAKEREAVVGKTDLRDTAQAVAGALESKLEGLDEYAFTQGVLFGSENNVAFALQSLWGWAEHTGDAELSQRLEAFTKSRILGQEMDSWCPLPVDGSPESFEFLPPCLQRATTVLSVMPEQISNKWLAEFVAAQDQLSPVTHTSLSTHGSLNFARAWSLWDLYKSTGEDRFRDMYIAHVDAQMNVLERAKARGESIDPWQAAFGVHALMASY